ncbi:PepSY domain-containing protein [Lutibacter maritimus]|uniref:PepSY-associated TM region n=1 Tax=Lutibacter maritimus TaxID=593133 RepID=A0A1I6R2J3_9FLAO|nr:PepSY domain-containing protein [Lutibacter maritimus]SFS58738.1 PepSY-associated TM region [Lutibacter maritimus]
MKNKKSTQFYVRIVHRYLGFFLAGIMTVYALSGVLLIFRTTDFLKTENLENKKLQPSLTINEVGKALKIKDIELVKAENSIYYFKNGSYNTQTGAAKFTSKKLPVVLDKMTRLHKATTNEPLYWLNIFFGVSLLFFAISSFWMFLPKTKTFKKGLYYTLGGIILTLILLFV